MNRLSSFFSFELSYQIVPLRRRLGGAPEAGDQLPPKPLAVPVFIVQNGRGLSWLTQRAAAMDRAEIGR